MHFFGVLGLQDLQSCLKLSFYFLGVSYTLDIRPLFVLKNCLPYPVFYGIGGTDLEREDSIVFQDLEEGKSGNLPQIRFQYASLHLKLFGFRNMNWKCAQLVENDFPEISQWKFKSEDGGSKFDLDIHCVKSCGTYVLSIYAPFWMINKTVNITCILLVPKFNICTVL